MEEENQTINNEAPKKKGSKKPLVVCLCIILILAVAAAGIIAYLVFSGKLNVSKKAKMQAGVEQLTESLIKPLNDITEAIETEDLTVKVLDNISADKPITIDSEISAKIDELEIPDLSTSNRETLKDVQAFLNGTTLKGTIAYDGKENVYLSGAAVVSDNEVSAEAMYKDEELLIRAKEASEKWLAVPKDELLEAMEIKESDIEEFKEEFEKILDESTKAIEEMEIDQKTSEEIQERYKKVLKDYVAKKEKDIKTEKTKVKVGGKEKSAQKLTLTLDEKDIKALAKNYVKTFKEDTQLQGIIKDSINSYSESLKSLESTELGEYYDDLEDLNDEWDEFMDSLDEFSDEIDELSIPVKVKLIVYATNTDVLRTDIVIDSESVSIKLQTTYETDDKSVTEISMKYGDEEIKIGTLEIESTKEGGKIKLVGSEMMAKNLNVDNASAEISYKMTGSRQEMTISVDVGTYGKGTFTTESNVTTNTDSEYKGDGKLTVDIKSDYLDMSMKGSISYKVGIKTDADFPSVSDSEKVDFNDEAAARAYLQGVATELKKSDNKIRKFVMTDNVNRIVKNISGSSAVELLDETIKELESSLNQTVTPTPTVIPAA